VTLLYLSCPCFAVAVAAVVVATVAADVAAVAVATIFAWTKYS
jgi:uncharacterized membrane protein